MATTAAASGVVLAADLPRRPFRFGDCSLEGEPDPDVHRRAPPRCDPRAAAATPDRVRGGLHTQVRRLMLALLRCCCPIMRPPFTVFALACFFPFTSMAWAWASRATAFQSRIEKQQSSAALRDRGDCVLIIVVYTCVLYTWAINFNLRLYMPGHCVHLSFRCQWWHVCFS